MRLRRLEPVLRRALRGPCRLPRGSTLLVAVSGGADSTALLVALASLAREFDLVLHAAHLHHGLRGRDADADLRHVRELCERWSIPLTSARWDCAARMRRRALAGEAGLRTLRREFLLRVARRWRASAIATAHTADDQLETLLMRLGRGTGLTGAAGMRARHGPWLKPLLHATRADVEADLTRHRIAWREDASNASLAFVRNRVRHAVVPALLDALGTATAGRGASPVVRRAGLARRASALAGELAGVCGTLERASARALTRVLHETPSGPALQLDGLAGLAPALRRPVLRRAWRLLGPGEGPVGEPAPGLTTRHLDALLGSLSGRRIRSEAALPGGWIARMGQGQLRFVPPVRAGGTLAGGITRRVGPADARLRDTVAGTRSGPVLGPSRRAGTDGRPLTTVRR